MKKFSFYVLLFVSSSFFSQTIHNDLHGYFKAKSDTLIYDYFAFDGNGKVDISDFGKKDFFQKGDSVFVYTDKEVFKFKLENITLKGISFWIENGNWIKQDTIIANNRKDDLKVQNTAVLLSEYYELTKKSKQSFDILFDENLQKERLLKVASLCEGGLSKACLEKFAWDFANEMGGLGNVLSNKKTKSKSINPNLVALANKIIDMGEDDGYAVLGSYYYSIGEKKKATETWEKGAELGNQKSILTQLQADSE